MSDSELSTHTADEGYDPGALQRCARGPRRRVAPAVPAVDGDGAVTVQGAGTLCRYGANCVRHMCWHRHVPRRRADDQPALLVCRFGSSCRRMACFRSHEGQLGGDQGGRDAARAIAAIADQVAVLNTTQREQAALAYVLKREHLQLRLAFENLESTIVSDMTNCNGGVDILRKQVASAPEGPHGPVAQGAQKERMDELEERLSDITDQVNEKADRIGRIEGIVTELQTRASSIVPMEKGISRVEEAVAGLEAKTACLAGFGERLSGIAAQVGNKADDAGVKKTIRRVEEVVAALELRATRIDERLSLVAAQVDEKADEAMVQRKVVYFEEVSSALEKTASLAGYDERLARIAAHVERLEERMCKRRSDLQHALDDAERMKSRPSARAKPTGSARWWRWGG